MAKEPKAAAPRQTKLDMVRQLLMRAKGASLADICSATGWQPHSARAALSGLRKAGYTIERNTDAGVSIYRITAVSNAPA